MSPAVQRLRAEIRFDRDAFARRVGELASIELSLGPERAAERAQAAVAPTTPTAPSRASWVRVARYLEGDAPQGADWHQALLHSMGLDVEGVRPAVFSPATIRVLRRLLGFRHFFRHAYAVELDADQLGILRGEILAAAPAILREIDALDSFLARVAAAGSD